MDPDSVKSTLSTWPSARPSPPAARDLQKGTDRRPNCHLPPPMFQRRHALPRPRSDPSFGSWLADGVASASDPELEKLHAERIAALKKEAEKREVLKRKGHGEYREITEGDFLGEVTSSEKVICHFYHPRILPLHEGHCRGPVNWVSDLGSKDDFSTRALEIFSR
ncbi:hypothetical protein HU200_005885 [Digitaria exilis]|uniref:Uncharacterized protein n=1 Tax=Digitaria exilis TaxID=1010633 RepID=A0A835KR35_9POAL|nr:hypothetical protein HU200_005885 [Digitaria exilis]